MTKKFELVKDDAPAGLFRIKALRDFGFVKAGALGGFVKSEENLSQNGCCWVYGRAQITGCARVSGDALIYDRAQVKDRAKVYGGAVILGEVVVKDDAQIYGTTSVRDSAQIKGRAQVYGEADVYGPSVISDEAQIYGRAEIVNAQISGDAIVAGDVRAEAGALISTGARFFGYEVIKGEEGE